MAQGRPVHWEGCPGDDLARGSCPWVASPREEVHHEEEDRSRWIGNNSDRFLEGVFLVVARTWGRRWDEDTAATADTAADMVDLEENTSVAVIVVAAVAGSTVVEDAVGDVAVDVAADGAEVSGRTGHFAANRVLGVVQRTPVDHSDPHSD